MKRRKFFKSKLQMVLYLIMFAVFMAGFIYFGTRDYSNKKINDNEKFAEEHKIVGEDNIFTYIKVNEAYEHIRENNTIILFGVSNDDYVSKYASILNEVAKQMNIKTIYYYDITLDRKDDNATYRTIVNYLENYVIYLDNNEGEIYTPALVVKKDGNIIYFDNEGAIRNGKILVDDYWTEYQINLTKNTLTDVFNEYLGSENNG